MGFLVVCFYACLYFLIKVFIILFKYIQKKSLPLIKGKITGFKGVKNNFDGKKSFREYSYEFTPNNDEKIIDFVEITSTKDKSKLSVGMILDIYYDIKLKHYHSLQQLKRALINNIIGFIGFVIILVVGFIILINI